MSATVIGILLILLGALAIFFMPKSDAKPATSSDASAEAKTEASTTGTADNEEEKKKQSAEAAANR